MFQTEHSCTSSIRCTVHAASGLGVRLPSFLGEVISLQLKEENFQNSLNLKHELLQTQESEWAGQPERDSGQQPVVPAREGSGLASAA